MCELFAMSALHPTTVRMSLEEFSRHGGLSGPHKDGWGIGWYEDRDFRLVKERDPAASSACVRFIQTNPFSSSLVLSHIRKATLGPVASRNCQPFVRELGGAWHSFAHNGDLKGLAGHSRLRAEGFRPIGETDSELAFCALLDALRPLWSRGALPPIAERSRPSAGSPPLCANSVRQISYTAMAMRCSCTPTAGIRATARSGRRACGGWRGTVPQAANLRRKGCGSRPRAVSRRCFWQRACRLRRKGG
jgi:predicted glutamine amidotransferase